MNPPIEISGQEMDQLVTALDSLADGDRVVEMLVARGSSVILICLLLLGH